MLCQQRDLLKTVSFTGYRPQKLSFGSDENAPEAIRLKSILRSEIQKLIDKHYVYFQTGAAMGVDMMCAEIVLELMETNPKVMLFAIIPCKNQCAAWDEKSVARYKSIMQRVSGSYLVSDSEYYNGCMQKRNQYLVDTADVLLAVYDGAKGGTANTIEYAKKQGRKIIIVSPSDFTKVQLIENNEQLTIFD